MDGGNGNTKTEKIVGAVRLPRVAEGTASEPSNIVERAAAHNTWSRRFIFFAPIISLVRIFLIKCRSPFPHITDHVQHTERACAFWKRAGRCDTHEPILFTPNISESLQSLIPPRIRMLRSSARGGFPFVFRRQTFPRPLAIPLGVEPVDGHGRALRAFLAASVKRFIIFRFEQLVLGDCNFCQVDQKLRQGCAIEPPVLPDLKWRHVFRGNPVRSRRNPDHHRLVFMMDYRRQMKLSGHVCRGCGSDRGPGVLNRSFRLGLLGSGSRCRYSNRFPRLMFGFGKQGSRTGPLVGRRRFVRGRTAEREQGRQQQDC